MEYAGFWRRAGALTIDVIIFGIFQAILMIVVIGSVTVSEPSDEAAGAAAIGLNIVVIVAAWLYFALMESSSKQATVGKMMIGAVVTDLDGNRISFGRASGRYFGKFVSGIILGIGYIMAVFTQRKQALHDIMAGCLVVRKPEAA